MADILFREFCNHIYLGQWELARACAFTLYKSDYNSDEYKLKLISTIQSITRDPYLAKSAWSTLPCPSYVNFLSCKLLSDLGFEDEGKAEKNVVDFHILLEMVLASPEKVLKELSSVFNEVTKIKNNSSSMKCCPDFELSHDCINTLKNSFKENPVHVSLLLAKLSLPSQKQFNLNFVFCNMFYQLLLNSIKSAESLSSKNENTQLLKNLTSKIYHLLSCFPEFATEEDTELEKIFLSCLDLCDLGILKLEKIYSALLGHSSLLKYFFKLEDLKLITKESKAVDLLPKPSFITDSGGFYHRGALLWSINNNSHFLQHLMDYYITIILSGKWESINSQICDISPCLKSLCLILSWEKCRDDASAMNVMQVVKKWNENVADPVLNAACKKFKLNVSLAEMCISNYKELFPTANHAEIQSQARRILSYLQAQSLLRVLHSVFGLKNVPPERLKQMLMHNQEFFNDTNVNTSTYLTDEAIYSGYIILVLIMEAVHLCGEFKDIIEAKGINLSNISYKMHDNKSETEGECAIENEDLSTFVNKYGFQDTYSKFIVVKLENARQKLKSLFPLCFRVEILENVFSMLFLMVQNLVDFSESHYDSDQGHEGEVQFFDKLDSVSVESVDAVNKKFEDMFIISTTKLKDSAMLKKNAIENASGHSSKSTESTSSSGFQPHTFLCNELITRDLLSLLKDTVLEAKAEVYNLIGSHDSNATQDASFNKHDSNYDIKLQVNNYSECAERTSKLLQHVNEAIWRYEVVQRDIFQERICLINRHKSKPHLLQSQGSTSSSEGIDKEVKKHRKRKKHKHSGSSQKDESIAESSIIQCMLSPPEALLRYSLWNGNFEQAGQIIKLFNLQSSDEAKELTLISELQQISNKLLTYDKVKEKSIKRSLPFSDKAIGSNVTSIKNAVSLGLQTSSFYMTIHQELSSVNVLQVIDVMGKVQHPELQLGSENIYSVFLIDLAFVSDISLELASSLLDSANKSWISINSDIIDFETKPQLQRKTPLIRGNSKVLNMMNCLLKEFLSFFKENDHQNDLCSIFWPIKKHFRTLPQVLPNFIGNLNHVRFKEEVNNWKNASSLIEEFTNLIEQEELNELKGILGKDIKQENKLHMTYKRLSRSLRELRDWSSRTISSEITHYKDYLSKLFIHLRQVTTAALECKNQNISSGQAIYTSDFSILKESPVELLKKIILQTGVTPKKIETFAIRMKVDLVRVLAQACLPYVPLLKENISLHKLLKPSYQLQHNGYPVYVLNIGKQDWPEPKHPDLVARELLRDLISMFQETAMVNDSNEIFKAEELTSLTQHSHLISWMEDCSQLAYVDLDLLHTREEKLAFFTNVTNIAWLYAVLLQAMLGKSQEKEKEETKTPDYFEYNIDGNSDFSQELLLSSNNLERFTVQKILGFAIGQLGPISLFDLRYQLLHSQLPVPKHLEIPPFHKLFDEKKPVWEKYMPSLEPRLLFVLIEGLLHSPKLQVLYSENIDESLEKAMKDYFDFTIHIDVNNDTVVLPQLLEWYALDFSKDDENYLDKAPYEGLINLLSTLVRPHLSELFQAILSDDSAYNFSENIDSSGKKQLPFTLKFEGPPLSFGIVLEYCSVRTVQPGTKKAILMDPQPIILNYLKEKCSILTDLYEIIIKENVSEYLSELDTNTPVFNLLKHYNKLTLTSDNSNAWFSSALNSSPDRKFFIQQIELFITSNMWHQALLCLDIYLAYCGKNEFNLNLARQLLLQHISSITQSASASDPSNYALCISDPLCRANTVLQNLHKWGEHSALKALKYCLSDSKILDFPDVHLALKNKLREIQLFKKIVDASEAEGSSEAKDCVYVFNNWQEVADCSIWDQSRILDFLNSCEKYDLAVEWTELNSINNQQKITALSMNLLWYLSQDPPNDQALKVLDSVDSSDCLKLCDIVLPRLSSIEAKLCLVQYLIDNVTIDNQKYYYSMFFGLKMLSSLKSLTREVYSDLVAFPYLLLEQMLMNLELRDAEKAIKAIESDLEFLSDIAPVLSISSVNQLVEDYASKALEVHFLDALLDTSSSSTLILSLEDSVIIDEPFVMPIRVPTKEEWIPDAKIHRCQVCKEERFNMFSRRHHCRRCGRVVCGNCSQHALIVEGYGNVKVRVCEDCYNLMTGSVSVTSSSFDKRYRILSSMQSSPRNSPYQDSVLTRRRMSGIQTQAFRWVLSSDSEQNASVRNEFSYEQAPSISLCFSILRLHRDPKKCAQFMLNLCDRLLGKIKPRRSGKLPVEIDYSLIISMIKSLLLNAKVSCHQVHDSEGEALADLYFQHLDILKLLVNANCRHLLPREALTSNDTARKLRDKLLEEERMNLALEVSTKFNLDKTGVWSSWGLFCIRAGDLPAARTKFQQCLKVINDKNDPKQESPVLNKILEVLEKSKYAGTEKGAAIYKSLSYLKNIENGTNWLKSENTAMDGLIMKECLYYLNAYGTHISTVKFYQRNNLTHEALNYIIQKKCDPETFIEAIFMPMLRNVQLSSLKYDLTSIDPTLSMWWNYLFATCRHLERLKYLNVLYEMQLFMEDYVRAAKSAINFYLSPASSYKILSDRQRYLYNAKKHYQKYLRDSKVDTSSFPQKNKFVKILSPQEAEKYIEVINLQEEVTNFFQLCMSQNNQASLIEINSDGKLSKSTCPLTLFGNTQKKAQVALMVILNAINVDDGFELAIKIIQTFGLDTTAILCDAGKELVRISQKAQIPHFLACVKCCFSKMVKVDEVILECVSEINKQKGEVEDIIKMLTSDINKINAYLLCDKLKSAYFLAIKLKSALDVRRVLVAAEQSGQVAIQQICKKWLESNSEVKSKQ